MTEQVLKENIGDELTVKQELFCQFYTQNTKLFGNATLAYAEAYGFELDEADKLDEVIEFASGEVMTLREKEDLDFKGLLPKGKYRTIQSSTYTSKYNSCSASSSQLLRNPKIDRRIVELLNDSLTDANIDAEITKVIKQNNDLGAKMRAIGEYNKLRQRIVDKVDHTSKGEKIGGFNFIMPEEPVVKPTAELPALNIEMPDEHNNSDNQTDIQTSTSMEGTSL